MIRSVRARFTLWFIASLLLLFVIASGVSGLFFLRHTLRILDKRLLESSALIETQISACAPEAQGEAFQERFEALLHSAFPFDLVFAQLFKAPESDATAHYFWQVHHRFPPPHSLYLISRIRVVRQTRSSLKRPFWSHFTSNSEF